MTPTRERHYVNLTNGLESLREVVDAGAPWSFLRLQSTTIERQDWVKLFLTDLSDDLLMHLALGWRCVVHDRGTNRPFSKTIYYALPLVKYVLDRRWYEHAPAEVWNRGLAPAPGGVQLVGACSATSHDGDGAYYRGLAHAALVPTPEPTYDAAHV